jgi:glycosyltransferase involved in cell wall biosynthesis
MKIAAITNSLIPSSTANSIQVMKVCDAMRQAGQEVCVWAPGKRQVEFASLKPQYGLVSDFKVRWLPSVRRLKRYDFTLSTLRAARRWGADLVYTWLPQVAVGALALGMPTVLEAHDRATGRFGLFWLKRFLQAGGKKQLVVVSAALRHALEEQTGLSITDQAVVIAPNGVDLARYQGLPSSQEARRKLLLREAPTVGYTGHFYAGRGVDLLFSIARAFPDCLHLWIGGREEELAPLRARLAAENLPQVTLTGFIPNDQLAMYQAASDILLMPYERAIAGSSGGNSADICSPMKMFEYLAVGRAIVSSDLPVIHEVLDESCAIFCQPEDPAGWVAAIRRLLDDMTLRLRLSEKALRVSRALGVDARQQRILRFLEDKA